MSQISRRHILFASAAASLLRRLDAATLDQVRLSITSDEIDEDLLKAGGNEGAGEAEDDATVVVAEHPLVNGGGSGKVTGTVGHGLHGVDEGDDIVLLNIDVADGRGEKIVFRRHSEDKNSKGKRG